MRKALEVARAAIAAGCLAAVTAWGSTLQFIVEATNVYGPLTEVGDTTITVTLDPDVPAPPGGAHFRCGATGALVQGTVIQISAIVDPGNPSEIPGQDCEAIARANVGALQPGNYVVAASIFAPGRQITTVTTGFSITARGAKCNVDPTANQLLVALANKTVDEFRSTLAGDSAYRAALGNIAFVGTTSIFGATPGAIVAFPPLDDPVRVMDRLQRSGEFASVAGNSMICLSPPPPDGIGTAVEYYSAILEHYFFTADRSEQQALDVGVVPGGWQRTGNSFRVILHPGCPLAREGGTHPVYRFAGEPDIGPNSHFFTASQDECGYVRDRADWHWMFEGAPFWASEPVDGSCPAGQQRLYRAFNNGKGGAPNHRYATDHAVIDAMVAQGWSDEGAAMCVPAAP